MKEKIINEINEVLMKNHQEEDLRLLSEKIYTKLERHNLIKENVLRLISPVSNKNRYFYVVYQAGAVNGTLTGSLYVSASSKNPKLIGDLVLKFLKKNMENLNQVIVLNLIELSEAEYLETTK